MRARQLRAALALQRNLRKLRTAALCSALLAGAAYSAKSHADAASASLGVGCVVPPRVEASVDYQAEQLAVTPADVERGYVDAPSASRLTVKTNSRAGYIVDFYTRLPMFRSARVQSAAAGGDIGRDGGTMIDRRRGPAVQAQITYRFMLDKNVAPGVYPWPLALVVRPL